MSFWQKHGDLISALATVVITVVTAKLAQTAITRRGRKVATVLAGGELSADTETRFRILSRLVVLVIFLIGGALALRYVDQVDRVADGLLASSALLGLVIGFAARATLANFAAGLMLVLTQVVRVGDRVSWQGQEGVVEDVRLNYTFIRTGGGHRLVVPNSSLAADTFENRTVVDPLSQVEVSLWLPISRPVEIAKNTLVAALPDSAVTVTDQDREGFELTVTAQAPDPSSAELLTHELREQAITALQGIAN